MRCAASFFLEIRQYSCEKMSCATQKSLAAGHIMRFQIHPRQYSKYLSRSDFPFQELFAYKGSNQKVDLFFLWDRYFPRNKRSIICIIATFLKISMQHNLHLRRILPCRFVHFAAGGCPSPQNSPLRAAPPPWSTPRGCFFPYSFPPFRISPLFFLPSPSFFSGERPRGLFGSPRDGVGPPRPGPASRFSFCFPLFRFFFFTLSAPPSSFVRNAGPAERVRPGAPLDASQLVVESLRQRADPVLIDLRISHCSTPTLRWAK